MPSDSILCEKDGSLARITLNRPDDANALDFGMLEALYEAALACAGDPEVRAVLLSANGPMFSGGGDLKYFRTLQGTGDIGREISRLTTYFHGAVSTLARMDAPVVCAVHATAAGGGLSLAMACDVVFAARSAKFSLAYTAAGLSPDGSSTWFLPRLVGLRRARELMLTSRRFAADEALDLGVVDRVCDDDAVTEEAEAQARAFAAGPTRAYASVKRLLLASMGNGLETQMDAEARGIAAAAGSADGVEGIAAFSEKRQPSFRGG